MSRIVVLKTDSEAISEEEAIATIENLADAYNLRVTIGDRKRNEDQRFDVMDMMEVYKKDLAASVEKSDLLPLVEEDEGIIGYLIRGSEDRVLGYLNGTQ